MCVCVCVTWHQSHETAIVLVRHSSHHDTAVEHNVHSDYSFFIRKVSLSRTKLATQKHRLNLIDFRCISSHHTTYVWRRWYSQFCIWWNESLDVGDVNVAGRLHRCAWCPLSTSAMINYSILLIFRMFRRRGGPIWRWPVIAFAVHHFREFVVLTAYRWAGDDILQHEKCIWTLNNDSDTFLPFRHSFWASKVHRPTFTSVQCTTASHHIEINIVPHRKNWLSFGRSFVIFSSHHFIRLACHLEFGCGGAVHFQFLPTNKNGKQSHPKYKPLIAEDSVYEHRKSQAILWLQMYMWNVDVMNASSLPSNSKVNLNFIRL